MASHRSHAALDSKQIEHELRVPRRGTDASRMMLRKVGPALRNHEREMVMLIPQLRSFGACSGFLTDTCPLGTQR